MLNKTIKTLGMVAVIAIGTASNVHAWTLDNDASKLSYGSIKKDTVGEVNSFEKLTGSVSKSGDVKIDIDLTSVQTNIDIRNERMNKFVFGGVTTASLNAKVDMAELNALAVGKTTVMDVEGKLSFLGLDVDIETEMFVARLSEKQVMVTTNDMIFVGTEDLGVSAGVDKLMELAKLPGITRTVPVTLRLVFNNDVKNASVVPAAATTQVALAGDVKAGKSVFKRCKACHAVKAGKNGVGPSLHGVIGSKAGAVEGYKYSKAMAGSGLVWDTATLSTFLAKPKAVVKGNKMAFPGLKKDKDIENVLAYIQSKSS